MIKYRLLVLSVVSCVLVLLMILFCLSYTQRLKAYNDFFFFEIETRSNYLNDMLFSFGYGHTIHNFKNLVMRGHQALDSQRYNERLQINSEQFAVSLDKYVAQVNSNSLTDHEMIDNPQQLQATERAALKKIRSVYENYVNFTATVNEMHRQGLSLGEIDQLVRVDDRPAIEGFTQLKLTIQQLRKKTLARSNQLVNQLDVVILISTLVLGVLILTSLVIAYQLLRPVVHLSNQVEKLAAGELSAEALHYRHRDEFHHLTESIRSIASQRAP